MQTYDVTFRSAHVQKMCYFIVGQLTDNQLQDFQLFLSEEVGGSEELVTSTPAEVDDIYTFSFTPPRNVSVITIRRPTTNLIVLCELQAFAGKVLVLFKTCSYFISG